MRGKRASEIPTLWHSCCIIFFELEHRRANCPSHKYRPPVSLGKGRSFERPSIFNPCRKKKGRNKLRPYNHGSCQGWSPLKAHTIVLKCRNIQNLQAIVAYEGELKVDQKQSEIWGARILNVYLGCGLHHTGDSRADASNRRERTNTGAGSLHAHFADHDPRASNTYARTHPVAHPNPLTNDHTHPHADPSDDQRYGQHTL